MQLHLGDSLEVLKTLPANSVDSVVTDPPYGLAFMEKKWDYDVPKVDLWREVLRVLKPGGHLLSFGGTRTYHRMVVAIEDAGFEVRDMICWHYGSGFPKSMDVSKAIDKAAGAERTEQAWVDAYHDGGSRQETQSKGYEPGTDKSGLGNGNFRTLPATDDAKRWQGFGTALKPATEPIVLARKPLSEKTVAKNVLTFGTGALNIDGCRIGAGNLKPVRVATSALPSNGKYGDGLNGSKAVADSTQGRWPANVLFDEAAAAVLDEQSGEARSSGKYSPKEHRSTKGFIGKPNELTNHKMYSDSGGASRFFYVAKASKRERNAGLEGMPEVLRTDADGLKMSDPRMSKPQQRIGNQNHHPTVKPVKLMEYLIKLVTPPGGTVLEPFLGSGTTLVAAAKLGFQGIGIEREAEYLEIAKRRIQHFKAETEMPTEDDDQMEFDTGA